ncbi:MAG TPA: GC-type dockerin domain-anchored protein [Phycisphaerales bacterium]|nr:GC-type dockerin domain-anchored protein [Phycisphaerales bacterium]
MNRLHTFVLGAVLAAAALAPAQDFTTFPIEPDATYTIDFGDQFYGALCAGPGEYFGAWVDLRVGGANPAGYDLYAQRIRPDGSRAHPGSLKLLRDDDRMTSGIPAVAWSGQHYLTLWYEGSVLYGMRITPDAEILDPAGFVVSGGASHQNWPAAAGDGQGGFLAVYGASGSILAHRIDADGTVLDPSPIVIASGASGLGYPKVTFAAGVYTVVWAQAPNQRILAARVTPDGQVLDPGGVNVSGGGVDVDAHVDFDGENFYVVWQRNSGSWWDLWGAHFSPQGQVVGSPRLILAGSSFGAISGGQVAFNGTHHVVTIVTGEPVFSNSDLYAIMVDKAGNPGSPFPVCTLDGRSQVSYGIASVGDQFFTLWEGNYVRGIFYTYDTEGARIDAAGNVLDRPAPIDVSTSAAWQIDSSTSFDGQNYLCVFEDWREGKPNYQADLYGVRVTPQGQVLDTAAFPVARSSNRAQGYPDAVFGAGQHAVVYENNDGAVNEVRMQRVLPDGTVRDGANGMLVFANEPTADTFRPKIAFNGEKYAVVWYDNYLFSGQKPLQFALIRPDGTREIGPVNIPNSDFAALNGFEIASNGEEFLVGWVGFDRVHATRISSSGAVLGTQTVQTTGNWITELTRVAFNGENYLLAWAKWGGDGITTYARLVSATGIPLSETFVAVQPDAVPLEILVSGSDFLVVYGAGDGAPDGTTFTRMQRIDATGALVGEPETLFSGPRWEHYGSSSFEEGPAGGAMMTLSFWADDPYNGARAQGLLFDIGAGCAADFNGDGAVNTLDVLAFLNAWNDGDNRADFNGDGTLDTRDVLAFLNAWTAGC